MQRKIEPFVYVPTGNVTKCKARITSMTECIQNRAEKFSVRVFKTQSCKTFFHFIGSLYYELDTSILFHLFSKKREAHSKSAHKKKSFDVKLMKKNQNSYSIRERERWKCIWRLRKTVNKQSSVIWTDSRIFFLLLFYISVYDEDQPLFLAALWRKPIFFCYY